MQLHVVDCYRRIYRARRMEGRISEPLYPGIAQLLHNLHRGGWLLAVATGKSERGLRACLETHGILDLFSRSEERRVGEACISACRTRLSQYYSKNTNKEIYI